MKKSLIIVLGFALLALGVWLIVSSGMGEHKAPEVTSFEECAAAGNPIEESYPRQCHIGAVTYFEDIVGKVPTSTSSEGSTGGTERGVKAGPSTTNPSVACTMEAMLCPDGSYVARSGPNCEFAKCPGAK